MTCKAVEQKAREMTCGAAERIESLEAEIEELKEKLDERADDAKSQDSTMRERLEKVAELVDYLDQHCACERVLKLVQDLQLFERMEYNQHLSKVRGQVAK